MAELAQRFWSKVKTPQFVGECWEWTAAKSSAGYGCVSVDGKDKLPHRLSYEMVVGPIPERLTIDHLCRNKLCVNPYHLEAVTQKENNLRVDSPVTENTRKTKCIRGHTLEGENLRKSKALLGVRNCRICFNEAQRLSREQIKARSGAKE